MFDDEFKAKDKPGIQLNHNVCILEMNQPTM